MRASGGFTTFYITTPFRHRVRAFPLLGEQWRQRGRGGEMTHEIYGLAFAASLTGRIGPTLLMDA